MELKSIQHTSAIYVAVLAFALYFLIGMLQLVLVSRVPAFSDITGAVSPVQVLILAPLVGAAVFYVVSFIAIIVYNMVARKYPISWEVSHR